MQNGIGRDRRAGGSRPGPAKKLQQLQAVNGQTMGSFRRQPEEYRTQATIEPQSRPLSTASLHVIPRIDRPRTDPADQFHSGDRYSRCSANGKSLRCEEQRQWQIAALRRIAKYKNDRCILQNKISYYAIA